MDWKKELASIVNSRTRATRAEQENAAFERFLAEVGTPALHQIAEEVKNLGREATVREGPASSIITVRNNGTEEITFQLMKHFAPVGILPCATVRIARNQKLIRYENIMLRPDPQTYPLSDVVLDDVIQCFLKHYRMVLGD